MPGLRCFFAFVLLAVFGCGSDPPANKPATGGTAGSGGKEQVQPPSPWPEGDGSVTASVTVVHQGKLLNASERLSFATQPAGIGAAVDLSFVVTNRGEALALGSDWVSGDHYSVVGTPVTSLAKDETTTVTIRFEPQLVAAATEAQGTLRVPFDGNTSVITLVAQVPRPLRGIVDGRGGYSAISLDNGLTWTDTVVPTETMSERQRITWGGGRFFRSWTNGTDWTSPGRYAWSEDGQTWYDASVSDTFCPFDCTWGIGRFFCARSSSITWSDNGATVIHESTSYSQLLNAVIFTGDRFIAVGRDSRRRISFDGLNWDTAYDRAGDYVDDLDAVAHGGGRVLAVGGWGGNRYTATVSNDGGSTWAHTHWNEGPYRRLQSVSWFNNRFIVTGSHAGSCMFETTDGIQFTPLAPPPGAGYCPVLLGVFNAALFAFRRINGQPGELLRSVDGTTWTVVHSVPAGQRVYSMAGEAIQ